MCIYWLSCFGGDLFSCFSTALLSKSERRDWESYALRWMFCCWSQVSTFIMMYRTHCQRILDTVIRANFDEARCLLNLKHHALSASFICNAKRHGFFFSWNLQVQSFLLHFWQGMPPHMLPVLGSPTVVNIVGVCDSILYKAISGVLMPTVLQALPDRWVLLGHHL